VPFRVTRDSDLDVDEDDIEDLLREVEKSLRKRKRGAAVRLEMGRTKNKKIKKFLEDNLSVDGRRSLRYRRTFGRHLFL
jgi:polyphosphate kinase